MNLFNRKYQATKRLLQFCVTATLLSAESQAAIIHLLDDLKVIEVPIANRDLTRITVKDDRISNVFGAVGEYVMEGDEENGQVFIRPIEPTPKTISLTLITESGHTQDLRLVPKSKPPEALILKAEDKKKETRDFVMRQEVEELLQACRDERIPLGYRSVPIKLEAYKGSHLLVHELKGEKLRGLTFEVKNTSNIPLIMVEEGFAKSADVVAVFMPKKLLHPGEKTHVYVAQKSVE